MIRGARCPHGCRPTRPMQWVEDQWRCPACGDEWHDETIAEGGAGDLTLANDDANSRVKL